MITINIDKAKNIAHDKRRAARAAEFAPLDVKATIPSEAAAAEAARAAVRAKYAEVQTQIDAAADVGALKTIVEGLYIMSTAKFNQWLNSDGTENYKCRAWVNFNGTGTVAIRASGNVSSITDNGTGDYTVNFTTALADANYSGIALFGNGNTVSVAPVADIGAAPTTSTFRVLSYLRSTGAALDVAYCNVSIFR